MVTLTNPSSTSNRAFDLLSNINDNILAVSFSSYLDKNEETYIQKLAESSRSLKGLKILNTPQEDLRYNSNISARMKKEPEDSEIGVFGADKYFKGEMDSDNSPRLVSQTNPEIYTGVKTEIVGGACSRANTKSTGTPSVRSESSWNSQSVLLQNLSKKSDSNSLHPEMNKKANKMSFLAKFGCKCSCSDENSVDVEENNSSTKKSTTPGLLVQENAARKSTSQEKLNGVSKENPFTFPTTSTEPENANLKTKPKFLERQEEEIQRKSSEKRNKSLSIEKKLTTIFSPWDPSPRNGEDEFSTNYEDSASDASSDLFEIENLTGKGKPFLANQGSDPPSPTSCYAPSEASIEWSVVTASAADFSVTSYCATTPVRNKVPVNHPNSNIKSNKEKQQRRRSSSSLWLGCKSQKAVRVSGDTYRTTDQKVNYVTRFLAEAKPAGF